MKITLFNGSPKGKRGNTSVVAEAFLRGAQAAGAETETILLHKKKINHCLGCLSCWTKTPGRCVQRDDMAELAEKYLASDIVVMATPLYVDNVSGMTKVFMDRLMIVCDPHFEPDENGETRHVKTAWQLPKIGVIATCGFPEQSQFQVLKLLFRRLARNMHGELVMEIYRSQGNLLTIPHDMITPIVEIYKKTVETAGRELIEQGKISDATATALDAPLVPKELYIDGANRHWDKAGA
jgi:multimeric flavodoxin WrbA